MKTSDIERKFSNFAQQRNEMLQKERIDDAPVNMSNNAERVISTNKNTNKIHYDNSAISMSFGQYNIEKCLFILLSLIILSTYIIYSYLRILDLLTLIFLITGGATDFIVSIIYLYLLFKLRSDNIFNKIPIQMINVSDYIVLINFLIKTVSLIMAYVNFSVIGWLGVVVFSLKFILDVYFVIISVKLFVFCPCSIYIHEQTEKLFDTIKYYVFCCEIEQRENLDYTRLEDLDSFE